MSTTKELIQKIVAIIIIFIMIFADFAIIGINAISYAKDMRITNDNNVEFCAYFEDKDKQQLNALETDINAIDLKMNLEIVVKDEGYFNGQISLQDTSFKFKSNLESKNEFIKELTDNEIQLNQINAGNIVKIEVGIEFKKGEYIRLQDLNKDNKISLTGVYKNSKKDINIQGNVTVRINWKSQDELKTNIDAELLTNKIYKFEEENKRIVQFLINSNLEGDLYPIKSTKINLNVPIGVENIKVHARNTDATNGNKEFHEQNYIYNTEGGILEINIDNKDDQGTISWIKDKTDCLIVTFIYPESIDLNKKEENIENLITTYDEKQINSNCKVLIDKEFNGVLTSNIHLDETEIYKGNLYTNQERFYTTKTTINVNYALMDKIKLEEKEPIFITNNGGKNSNIQYVQSKIKKEDFYKIFGEDGYIYISDQEGNILKNITNELETDDMGYINIHYNPGIKSVIINTSKPVTEDVLEIYHKKVIINDRYTRDEVREFIKIKEEIYNEYNGSDVKTIELKDTQMQADMEINKEIFSVGKRNENVVIQTKLFTNGEDKELYKNPTIKLRLPRDVKQIENAQVRIINGNGLKIKKSELNENHGIKEISIALEGEQLKYSNETLDGVLVQLRFDCTLNNTENKEESIYLKVTNENTEDIVKDSILVKLINPISKEVNTVENTILLENDSDIEIRQEVKAIVGNKILEDGAKVRSGEIIRYEIKLTNLGYKDLTGITMKGSIPIGTTRVVLEEVEDKDGLIIGGGDNEPVKKYQYVEKQGESIIFKNIDIKKGKNVTLGYEVRVDSQIVDNTKTICKIVTTCNHKNIETKINHILKTGDFVLQLEKPYRKSKTIKSGYNYMYSLSVTNISSTDKENLKLIINKNNLIKIVSITYIYDGKSYSNDNIEGEISIRHIKAGDTINISISTLVLEADNQLNTVDLSADLIDINNIIYYSNRIEEKVETTQVTLEVTSITNSTEELDYVSSGNIIKYIIGGKNNGKLDADMLNIQSKISDYLIIQRVKLNEKDVKCDKHTSFEDDKSYTTLSIEAPLKAGESCKIEIYTKVNEITTNEDLQVNNTVYAYNDICIANAEGDIYYIKNKTVFIPDETDKKNEDKENSENNGNDGDKNNSEDKNYTEDKDNTQNIQDIQVPENKIKHTITGNVWYDENKDGKRVEEEEKIGSIKIYLLNIDSNEIIFTYTNENGYYEFTNVEKGEYVVIFEYDANNYIATTYMAQGVPKTQNSDGMQTKIKINGEMKTVAITDNIKIARDIYNIDLGLAKAEKFDMELNKYVSKISVVNSKEVKTYEFDKLELAKVEIADKQLDSSIVIIEYIIEVKNTGEIPGYIESIVDYKPKSLEFSSDLNKEWYQSDKYLYNESLSDIEIGAGESKEVKLVLSKKMTDSNTGLVNNMAEIKSLRNSMEMEDIDSITGNKQNDEDDIGSADVIISIKTGSTFNYLILAISSIIIVISSIYILDRIKMNKKIYI